MTVAIFVQICEACINRGCRWRRAGGNETSGRRSHSDTMQHLEISIIYEKENRRGKSLRGGGIEEKPDDALYDALGIILVLFSDMA